MKKYNCRWLWLSFFVCQLAVAAAPPLLPRYQITGSDRLSLHKKLPHFDGIGLDGRFVVDIVADSPYSDVRILGDAKYAEKVRITVSEGVLHISHYSPDPIPRDALLIVIRTNELHHLYVKGENTVTGIGLHGAGLEINAINDGDIFLTGRNVGLRSLKTTGHGRIVMDHLRSASPVAITASGDSKTELLGFANLNRACLSDNAWLSVYWVESPRFSVVLKNHAYLQLAGRSGVYDAKAFNFAHFNARFLRSNDAYVMTSQKAMADVNVLEAQNLFARSESTINYYQLPAIGGHYMAGYGAVLDMVNLERHREAIARLNGRIHKLETLNHQKRFS